MKCVVNEANSAVRLVAKMSKLMVKGLEVRVAASHSCHHVRFLKLSSIVRSIFLLYMFFLFSAHISYGKGKYLNQTGFFFFLQNLPRFYLYLNLRVLPIEFNPHKFSFVRYVFVEIFEVFLKNDENDENDPLMTK